MIQGFRKETLDGSLRSDGCGMGNNRTFDARPGGAAARWAAAAGRPAGAQRHFLRAAHGHTVARPAGAVRSLHTAYNRFNRWAKEGVWVRVFETLAACSPASMQLIDSSIVRAHQHAAGGKGADHAIGRSRGGLSTKINARVDGRGLPVRLTLTASDARQARGCRVVARPAPRQRRRRRPQLRQPIGPRADRGGPRTAADPNAAPSSRPAQRRPGTLSPAQSRRALFQQAQTLPGE
jgi:transposase